MEENVASLQDKRSDSERIKNLIETKKSPLSGFVYFCRVHFTDNDSPIWSLKI